MSRRYNVREMAELPDVSDLLRRIEEARSLKEKFEAAEKLAEEARALIIERYEKAGVTHDECDHPLYSHRRGDSANVCCYCQRYYEE